MSQPDIGNENKPAHRSSLSIKFQAITNNKKSTHYLYVSCTLVMAPAFSLRMHALFRWDFMLMKLNWATSMNRFFFHG